MQKVNVPASQLGKFAGKWVAILGNRIVAVSKTMEGLNPLVRRDINDKTPHEKIPAAFKVPRKNEGPYIL